MKATELFASPGYRVQDFHKSNGVTKCYFKHHCQWRFASGRSRQLHPAGAAAGRRRQDGYGSRCQAATRGQERERNILQKAATDSPRGLEVQKHPVMLGPLLHDLVEGHDLLLRWFWLSGNRSWTLRVQIVHLASQLQQLSQFFKRR